MAPDQEGPLGFTGERGPLVARRVDLHLDRELGELISHPRSRRGPRVGPADALRALRVAGQLPKIAKLGDGADGRAPRAAIYRGR